MSFWQPQQVGTRLIHPCPVSVWQEKFADSCCHKHPKQPKEIPLGCRERPQEQPSRVGKKPQEGTTSASPTQAIGLPQVHSLQYKYTPFFQIGKLFCCYCFGNLDSTVDVSVWKYVTFLRYEVVLELKGFCLPIRHICIAESSCLSLRYRQPRLEAGPHHLQALRASVFSFAEWGYLCLPHKVVEMKSTHKVPGI